jgi:hypothetical protein
MIFSYVFGSSLLFYDSFFEFYLFFIQIFTYVLCFEFIYFLSKCLGILLF